MLIFLQSSQPINKIYHSFYEALKRLPVWYKLSVVSYMPRGKILYNVKWYLAKCLLRDITHIFKVRPHYGGNEKMTSLISVNKCWTLPAIWRIYPSHKLHLSAIGAVWGLYNWSQPLHKWVNICSFSNSVWFGLGWERALLFSNQIVLYLRGKKTG